MTPTVDADHPGAAHRLDELPHLLPDLQAELPGGEGDQSLKYRDNDDEDEDDEGNDDHVDDDDGAAPPRAPGGGHDDRDGPVPLLQLLLVRDVAE